MAKPLALTSGEPAGIGPDIAITAWLRRNELKLPPFYLLGNRDFFEGRAGMLGLKVEFAATTPEEAPAEFARALPVVATGEVATARPGCRPQGPLRPRQSAPCRVGPQSACRRGRLARNGRYRDRGAGDRNPAPRRHRGSRTAASGHHVPPGRAKNL